MRFALTCAVLALVFATTACDVVKSRLDPNGKPSYGDTGLAKNCRAYVQEVINGHRIALLKNDVKKMRDQIDGLERNCGSEGWLW